MFEVHHEFVFDAAHHFPGLPKGHRYQGMHGHSFRVVVTISGEPDEASGFVVDLEELERSCARLHERLDHSVLNDALGLEKPSLENIARWIWTQLAPSYAGLARITVARDSRGQGCTYTGNRKG
jgi:6-pyruvoyltetrahydropterin/6-carboxytetrahydropterin synthase